MLIMGGGEHGVVVRLGYMGNLYTFLPILL